MKHLFYLTFITLVFSLPAQAQLRSDLAMPYDYTGPIINENSPTVQSKLNKFFSSIKMSHSYEMSFSSFGGSYQNVNAYTNTMQFALSERMTGRVDVSFLHSPFGGNNNMYNNANNFQNQVVIRNAELNYQINDRASIHVSYQQLPSGYGYGYNPYGYGSRYSNRYNPYSRYGYDWLWY